MNVSKIIKNGSLATTKTGSPLYTSPEVWENIPYDEKSDIWSLGILIYELCCLKVPFEADNISELCYKIKNQKVKCIPSSYSVALLEIIKKMLEINPSNRITAEEIFKIAQEKLRLSTETNNDSI